MVVSCLQSTGNGKVQVVRISGLSLSLPLLHPLAHILNLVISFSVKWNEAAERYLAASGMPYTIVRAGALTPVPRTQDTPQVVADQGRMPSKASLRVGIADIAALCVQSLEHVACKNTTLTATWGKAPKDGTDQPATSVQWDEARLAALKSDTQAMPRKPFTTLGLIYGIVGVVAAFLALRAIIELLLTGVLKTLLVTLDLFVM